MFVCFTVQSWPHYILTWIRTCPLDWRKTLHGNVDPIICNITTYIRVVGKLSELHFNVLCCSNPGDKFLILAEIRGHICPIVFLCFRNLSSGFEQNYTMKYSFDNFPTSLIHVVMLENCLNTISMYGFSPIKGDICVYDLISSVSL